MTDSAVHVIAERDYSSVQFVRERSPTHKLGCVLLSRPLLMIRRIKHGLAFLCFELAFSASLPRCLARLYKKQVRFVT